MNKRRVFAIGAVVAAVPLMLVMTPNGAMANTRSKDNATSRHQAIATSHYHLTGTTGPTTDAFWESIECGGVQQAKAEGSTMTWYPDTAATGATQIAARIEAAGLGNPSGVVLAPQGNLNNTTFLQGFAKRHIPVIEVNELQGSPEYQVVESPEQDPSVIAMARVVAKETGGVGTVGILAVEAGVPQVEYRWQPFVAELKKIAPKLHVLGVQYDSDSATQAQTITAAEIVANPDLKAIWATAGVEGVGAAAAVKAAGKVGKVAIYAYDTEPNEVTLLKQHVIYGLIAQSPWDEGAWAVKDIIALLNSRNSPDAPIGTAPVFHLYTPTMVVDWANVNSPSVAHFVYHPTCG